MRSSIRARLAAAAATVGLILAGLTPSFAPVAAADPLVLRAGTDQDLQVLNPFNSILVVDFEVFTLNYDLLVNFGPDLEPSPGFAESWTASDDGLTWTFKIREGMKWSDGTPATSEDARWSYQLALDADAASQASEDGYYLAAGYLEPYLLNAGVSAVSAPDPQTLVVETSFANQLILQAYYPILPKHIWSEYSMDDIAMYSETPFMNEPPIVGTGPYQVAEWKPGEFIRYVRNPNYWGPKGAADEVILLTFEDADTMVQALKTGQVDYVRGVQPAQFDALKNEPNIVAVEGISNGYSEIAFNTKGNTEGYGGSTSALTDPKFRSALGYAVDTAKLVETTLGGYGVPGDSVVPPFHTRWYDQPDNLRAFDIDEANRLLDEAGYERDADGDRLDAEGNKIVLRVTWPDSEAEHETDAQLIEGWWEQLGIGVDAYVTEEGKLLEDLLPPVSDGPADFDIELWGWVGDPDPTSLLNVLRTEEIGNFSDSFWSNARYDELFELQRAEANEEARKAQIKEMQQIAYDEAPYIIMYYDAELHAYRTDKFAGWKNQPTNGGTPLFGYGSGGYNVLTVATADTGLGDQLPLILAGLGVAVLIIILALVVRRRRRPAAAEEE
ncbi:MAG TPA: ABC transporter substrate-binding protein [Candidatus Limnocylindrales bacterium]|nr:ABC transporter substrate-binding protein [Candidatus Limnocylindrales bacterium]